MNRLVITALAAAFAAMLAVSVLGASWEYVGTSAFSTTPSALQDFNRIKLHSIAVDKLGNVYVTANNEKNTVSGGITIFKTDGSQIDVNLATSLPGPVTKLVKGGDGLIYALQNYIEIEWPYNPGVIHRILGIDPNGNVSVIWTMPDADNENLIRGMTVGNDGNIYWVTNGVNYYWKYHFLWRYDVGAGSVEEAPINTTNNGWSEHHRIFDLEAVGKDALGNTVFSVIKSGSSEWRADPISWTMNRSYDADNIANPGWGRDWITATAYDTVRKKLWVGGRGGGSGPWVWSGSSTGGATIVDLGSGNTGIRITKGTGQDYYRLKWSDNGYSNVPAVTGATRFYVDSYTNYDGALMLIRPSSQGGENETSLRLKIVDDNYVVHNGASVVATLGPVKLGVWNEIHMIYDGTTNKADVWWNGAKVVNGVVTTGPTYYNYADSVFGAATRDDGNLGSCVAVFDWVRTAPQRVEYGDAWPGIIGSYVSGNCYPDLIKSTNIASRWGGAASSPGLFNTDTWEVASKDNWHTNGNDLSGGVPNNGRYWVSALEVNPGDGSAWMAWGAESGYDYDVLGTVWTRGTNLGYGSEGVPEEGAQVVALRYASGKMYALVCNMSSGAFSLYKADVPAYGPSPVAQIKQGPVGRYAQTDVAKIVTWPDPNDLTATAFYIQDADRAGAIRVEPAVGQARATVGQKASVVGYLDVKNGEAVIVANTVTASSTTEKAKPLAMSTNRVGGLQLGVQPPTLMGGSSNYGWPNWLNTTARLITIAGTLRVDPYTNDESIDDGSAFPVRIEYSPGSGYSDGDIIAVTGISGVAWDGANGFRVIIPRNEADFVKCN